VFEEKENYAGNKVITTGGKSSLLFEGGHKNIRDLAANVPFLQVI